MQKKRGLWLVLIILLWITTIGFSIAFGNCFHRIFEAVEASMIELINHELLMSTILYGGIAALALSCACVTTTMFVLSRSLN